MPFDGTLAEPVALTPSAEALANRILEIEEITRIRWRAAELLRTHGWCQRAHITAHGHRCLAQALIDADHGEAVQDKVTKLARSMGFDNGRALVHWNDATDRTKEEVIARLLGGSNAA